MKTRILTYALVAAGLLCGAAFQAAAQQQGGRGMILSQDDRAAVREALQGNSQMTQLRTDLAAAQKAAVEAALADNAKDEDVMAKLEAVAKIQNQIALAYCKAVKKAVKFSDDQTSQMKERAAIGYMTLFGGGGGFGGGRGRRAGGGGGGGGQ
jgi:hypothetical protein